MKQFDPELSPFVTAPSDAPFRRSIGLLRTQARRREVSNWKGKNLWLQSSSLVLRKLRLAAIGAALLCGIVNLLAFIGPVAMNRSLGA